jgi:hypothetical protein
MQVFHRSANTIARVTIFGALFFAAAAAYLAAMVTRSNYVTRVGEAIEQPVPFSHQHHVAGLGIDCRYCHTSVEDAAFAGIPPVSTCMNCHSQIWTNAEMLEPVRASYRSGKPIEWVRVHDVADFVQFNHSIHVRKGIGCDSCHGRVDQMPLMWKAEPMSMEFCLECHRSPEKFVRPRSEVFNLAYKAENQAVLGPQLVREYQIESKQTCSTCHY